MIDYNNKEVLVTGAASGIGAALAKAFTARGAQVVCADINADGLQQTLVATGNKAKAITCDLANPNVAEQLIDDVYTEMGRLDLVCSNAGIGFAGRLTKTDFFDPRIEKLFEINFFAGLKLGSAYSKPEDLKAMPVEYLVHNAYHAPKHLERSQPLARTTHHGLLEKKRDYILRARSFHKKETRIKAGSQQAGLYGKKGTRRTAAADRDHGS